MMHHHSLKQKFIKANIILGKTASRKKDIANGSVQRKIYIEKRQNQMSWKYSTKKKHL